MRTALRWLAVFTLILALPAGADAQRRRAGRAEQPPEGAMSVDEARPMLASANPDEILLGIEALATNGTTPAISPLADRIRGGLPHELLLAAVDALATIGKPEAGAVLFEMLRHRRADVRVAAVNAVIATKPQGAAAALVRAMDDPDPQVRAVAASGVGQVGGHAHVADLMHALDRGILEAAISVGQLANPEQARRLLEYLGRLPFDAVAPGITEMMARDDFPQPAKLEVIGRLAELATGEVRTYLEELLVALPDSRENRPLRDAIRDAVARIGA